MEIAVLGIDLGKNIRSDSCSVVGLDGSGRVVLRRRMHRDAVVKLASGLPACIMAMEACCGAHHLGRLLHEMGHQVRLMSPEYVRPYVKAQKNDDRDAEAIVERIAAYAAAGISKFILRPAAKGDEDVTAQTRRLIEEVLPLAAARWPKPAKRAAAQAAE